MPVPLFFFQKHLDKHTLQTASEGGYITLSVWSYAVYNSEMGQSGLTHLYSYTSIQLQKYFSCISESFPSLRNPHWPMKVDEKMTPSTIYLLINTANNSANKCLFCQHFNIDLRSVRSRGHYRIWHREKNGENILGLSKVCLHLALTPEKKTQQVQLIMVLFNILIKGS